MRLTAGNRSDAERPSLVGGSMVGRRLRILLTISFTVATVLGGTAAAVQGAPPGSPTLAVTPHTALGDLQTVTVTGAHFSAGVTVATLQCGPSTSGPAGCDFGTVAYSSADGSGAFTTKRAVRRLISLGTQQVDCATSACALVAANIGNYAEHALVTLGFDPSKPPVVPKVDVTPATKLVDHQLVTVSGTGFAPGANLSIFECLGGPAPSGPQDPFETCDTNAQRSVVVGNADTFTTKNVPAQRILFTFGPNGPQPTDCAKSTGGCVMRVFANTLGGSTTFQKPISFDPTKPVVAQSVSVSPVNGLVDHQLVTVHGSGFTPGVPVQVLECTAGSLSGFCDYSHLRGATPGLTGAFTVTLAVQRFIPTFVGLGGAGAQKTDCAARPGACALEVSAETGFGGAAAPRALTFLPRPAVRASLRVRPGDHLHDNQLVRVSGTGFTPLQPVQVVECTDAAVATASTDLTQCDATTNVVTTADRGGAFTADIAVHDTVGGTGVLAPCGTRHCVLLAVGAGQLLGFPGGFVSSSGSGVSDVASASSVPTNAGSAPSFATPRRTTSLAPSRDDAEARSTHPDLPYAVLTFGGAASR